MQQKIAMNRKSSLTIEEAFQLFIRRCKVKNLSENTIKSYEQKIVHFYAFMGKEQSIASINRNTIDDYVFYLRENTNANDISINTYLRCLRAFLYYCADCDYITPFKIHLIKAEKKLKETYTDEELERLLKKPDIHNCSFSTYKTWVFENYLLASGNRLSTALNLKIKDLNFDDHIISLSKTKSRKQQLSNLDDEEWLLLEKSFNLISQLEKVYSGKIFTCKINI